MTVNRTIEIQSDVGMAPLTTLKVGGPARFFVKAESERQVIEAFEFAKQSEVDLFVLGGGSNVLVSDAGFDGLVLQVAPKGIYVDSSGDTSDGSVSVTANAGEDWDAFVDHCVTNDLAGLECLSGIPGFVGGTPVQNVGAYGQEVSETITSVRCLDRSSGEVLQLSNADCRFAYRTSIFNSEMTDRFIVLAVTFALEKNGLPNIGYKDLIKIADGKDLSLQATRDAVLQIRRSKSMVIDENDQNSRSAGSFFKNPIVANEVAEKIADAPKFKVGDDTTKIAAAWLIENSGFAKGFKLGNAGISSKHSLALINLGGASAADIMELMKKIQKGVKDTFGIELRPEPVFIGFK